MAIYITKTQAHFPGESIYIMEDDFQWTDVSTAATHLEHVRDFVKKKAQVMDHYWGQIGTRFARQWKMHEDPRRGTYAVYILVLVFPLCLMIVIAAILIACIVSIKV